MLNTVKEAVAQQKESLKQVGLKQAVYDQKDRNYKKEVKELVKERNNMEGLLQRERGLNIQNTQQYAVCPLLIQHILQVGGY